MNSEQEGVTINDMKSGFEKTLKKPVEKKLVELTNLKA